MVSGQVSDSVLPASEKFFLGGLRYDRGYYSGEVTGDNAVVFSVNGDGLLSIDVTGAVKQLPHGPEGKPATALVTNSGAIIADGGTVLLTTRAADGLVQTLVDAGGRIQANSLGGRAGTIALAGIGGSLRVDGAVLAEGLASGARIGVSRRAGGGTAKLSAANTTVEAGVKITANATRSGHGGPVTVLSTSSTNHAGGIAARGGPNGGDGGTVEVSGEGRYVLTGTIDVGAPAGKAGNILVDPKDLTIVHGDAAAGNQNLALAAGTGTLGYAAADTTNDQVSDATINTFTGNVTLHATENLVVANGVTISLVAAPAQNLVLQAGNNLTVNSIADAPTNVTASGNIVLAASSSTIPGNSPAATNAGVLSVAGTLTSTHGGIFLSSDGSATTAGVTIGGTLNAATTGSAGVISVGGNTLALASTASLTAGVRVDFAAVGGALTVGACGQSRDRPGGNRQRALHPLGPGGAYRRRHHDRRRRCGVGHHLRQQLRGDEPGPRSDRHGVADGGNGCDREHADRPCRNADP